jgi:hypothetical protein
MVLTSAMLFSSHNSFSSSHSRHGTLIGVLFVGLLFQCLGQNKMSRFSCSLKALEISPFHSSKATQKDSALTISRHNFSGIAS